MARYRCEQCGHEHMETNNRGRVEEPIKCPNELCKARFTQRLMHNLCSFHDRQIIKMQVRLTGPFSLQKLSSPTVLCACNMQWHWPALQVSAARLLKLPSSQHPASPEAQGIRPSNPQPSVLMCCSLLEIPSRLCYQFSC